MKTNYLRNRTYSNVGFKFLIGSFAAFIFLFIAVISLLGLIIIWVNKVFDFFAAMRYNPDGVSDKKGE